LPALPQDRITLSDWRWSAPGAQVTADLYASGCSVLAAVTFPDQVVL
jgi:hypothetical protein